MSNRAELSIRARNVGIDPTNYPNDSKLEQRVIYEEKRSTAETGALATGTLTSSGTATAGKHITIGSITYTIVASLSEVKATATLTSDGTAPDDGDTVRIGSQIYTFKTTLSTNPTVANEVLIGVSAAAALDNLKSAINGSAGAGSTYSTGTVAHPDIEATTNTDTTQVVVARNWGTQWNDEPTLESSDHLSWGGTTLAGGVAPVKYEVLRGASAAATLDNLKAAINDSGTEGTHYSTGTVAHPEVTAEANTDTTQVVQAISYNSGNSIATASDDANFTWGGSVLSGGDPKNIAAVERDNAAVSGGARV